MSGSPAGVPPGRQYRRFHFAPPRRFVLPALLLLLLEEPDHGYSLAARLPELCFGHLDRPAIYRALAQLEADGLVTGRVEGPSVGGERRVYEVTPLGEETLGAWMGVIEQEHATLTRVLRRYHATGTASALIAEVEGGWLAALRPSHAAVSVTSDALSVRRARLGRQPCPPARDTQGTGDVVAVAAGAKEGDGTPGEAGGSQHGQRRRYNLLPERSAVLIEVRSTVGPISFGTLGVSGWVEAVVEAGTVQVEPPPSAHVEVEVRGLRSGNRLYDAELLRRIEAERFPVATVELASCAVGGLDEYRLDGSLTFHGSTREVRGAVKAVASGDGRLVVDGEQLFDMRDFSIPSSTVLMLRIYPDVRVRLHVEAALGAAA